MFYVVLLRVVIDSLHLALLMVDECLMLFPWTRAEWFGFKNFVEQLEIFDIHLTSLNQARGSIST